MTYFAEPYNIEYDEWFDENIEPLDLMNYSNEKEFSDSVHEKFYKISTPVSYTHLTLPTNREV